jgi:D-alanyl-D-alanine carboxypeptidase
VPIRRDTRSRYRPAMRRALLVVVAIAVLVGASIGLNLGRLQPGDPALAFATPSPSPVPSPASSAAASPQAPPFASPSVPAVGELSAAVRLRTDLQASLDKLRARDAIPGVSATIIFPDGSTWLGVSGLANVAAKAPVTPETAFAVGSISKTFLAVLVLDLVDEGKVRLEAPAREYVPNLPIDSTITIRQLLDHTSGLYDFFFKPGIDKALRADRSAIWIPSRTLRYVGKPYFKPGLGWHYSNTNYLILGLIAEKVGGTSVAKQLRDRYLGPLGLAQTFYEVAEKPRSQVAHGYRFAGSKKSLPPIDLADGTGVTPFRSVVTAAGAAGSIASTSSDIARWAHALYSGQVLDEASLELMIGDAKATALLKARVPYGLGVQEVAISGLPTLGHSGRLLGSQAVVRYFPDTGLTIAVLTNQNRADPSKILGELLRIAVPLPVTPVPPVVCTVGCPAP